MKLEFNSLNGLLHAALTYLCDKDCIIPGGANLAVGTEVTLEMSWPEGEQPIVVKGTSGGLDPAGRGLLLDIQDPAALHQVVMIMTHLHFGPYVGRQILDLFRLDRQSQEPIRATPPAPAEESLPSDSDITVLGIKRPELDEQKEDLLRTSLPNASGVSAPRRPQERKTGARPPRLRPPVIRPPVIRPTAARTLLPQRGDVDDQGGRTSTAMAILPELIASIDDLDDDY